MAARPHEDRCAAFVEVEKGLVLRPGAGWAQGVVEEERVMVVVAWVSQEACESDGVHRRYLRRKLTDDSRDWEREGERRLLSLRRLHEECGRQASRGALQRVYARVDHD